MQVRNLCFTQRRNVENLRKKKEGRGESMSSSFHWQTEMQIYGSSKQNAALEPTFFAIPAR